MTLVLSILFSLGPARTLRGDRLERGASLVEYVLLVALIALLCLAAVMWFGTATSSEFDDVTSRITTA